jgi:hypothetical protein
MDALTVTITDREMVDAIVKAAAQQGITPEEYVIQLINEICQKQTVRNKK